MSARTVALGLPYDATTREAIENALDGLLDDECERARDLAERYLAGVVHAGGKPSSDDILREFKCAAHDIRTARNANGSEPTAEELRDIPQATRIVQLGRRAELFCSPNGVPHASVEVDGRRETWPIKSAGFRGWLSRCYNAETKRIPRAQAMQDALGVLVTETIFHGAVEEVHVRVAVQGGAIYLDLADAERHVVEARADGWRIITDPPIRFRRPKGSLPLPMPERGGSLDDLMQLLNVGSDSMLLVQAWLLSALQPSGSIPVLVIQGEQGAAKSMGALLLKQVVDPSKAPLRSEPKESRDLMIAAVNSRVLAYDNLSHLPPWLSDALCRLSTGGGLSTRELYTDAEETILEAKRPVILTGIEELATRPDLLDRCVLIYLPTIADDRRRTESDLLRDFDAAHPRVLGALMDAVVTGLRNLPGVKLPGLPRMADFARWIVACSPALGVPPEAFLLAYSENRSGANSLALDSSAVAAAVLRLVERGPFEGTSQELLSRMEAQESPATVKNRLWPKTARGLTGALRRHSYNLRAVGVAVTFLPRQNSRRLVRVERASGVIGGDTVTTVTPSPSGEPSDGSDDGDGITASCSPCPRCGGRMQKWSFGPVCTSCHRRFQAEGVTAEVPGTMETPASLAEGGAA